MTSWGWVRFEHARELVRLVGETREVPAEGRGVHLIAGIRRMLGAVVGGCVIDRDFRPGGRGSFEAVALDGWDSSTLRTLEPAAERGSVSHPVLNALMQRPVANRGTVVTETRQRVLSARDWYRSPFVAEHLLPAHLDHVIISTMRADPPSIVQGLGFYRAKSDRPFDESDRALLHLFHLECGRLLSPLEGHPRALAPLSRRENETLNCLLEGLSDKDIAARLGISPLTVHGYNKALFRKFGVHSRAELVAKVNRGSPNRLAGAGA